MTTTAAAETIASERLMVGVRWLIALWATFQVSIDVDVYPGGTRGWAYALVGVLILGNLALLLATARPRSHRDAQRIAVASMAFDLLLVMAFVFVYAFDPDKSLWALMFLIPVEAAARFRMRGVVVSWAGLVVLYVAKEVWADAVFGHGVRVDSITFRMGLVLLVGVLAGRLARQLHDQKSELSTALERLEQVDGWRSRLVQMLAHDIRSPIGSIDSTAALLLARQDQLDPARSRRLLETIRRQAARVQHLAADLLDLARSESDALRLARERFDLAELLRETTPMVSGHDEAVTFGGGEHVEVVADRQRLAQVYTNLLGNALRHGRGPVHVELSTQDGNAVLAVTDAGDGVPVEREPDLFTAFSGGEAAGSVGLGLWMCRLLVEAHGGTVGYERDDAAGTTTFRVRCPAVPARSNDPEPVAELT